MKKGPIAVLIILILLTGFILYKFKLVSVDELKQVLSGGKREEVNSGESSPLEEGTPDASSSGNISKSKKEAKTGGAGVSEAAGGIGNESNKTDEILNITPPSEDMKIALWDIHPFDAADSSNSDLISTYSSKIEDYDIVFLQGITDTSGGAFQAICDSLQDYNCRSSSFSGRNESKRQYGLLYRRNVGINLNSFTDFNPDSQDRWEYPPISASFSIADYSFKVYSLSTNTQFVQQELAALESEVSNQGNVLILGDLNADCWHYNPESEQEFDSWNWVVGDDEDTLASSDDDCASDRIILNSDAYQEYSSYGVHYAGISEQIAGHYIVWVDLSLS